MKIAFEARPIKWSYGTGIGNYTYCLIEKLNKIDLTNEYTFLWPDHNPHPYIPFDREYSYYALPKDDLREENELQRWLELEQADLFHLPQNGFRIPKRKPGKVIVTIHDLIPYILPEVVRPSFLKRFITEMPEIIERSDHIIAVSEASKKDIIRLFGVSPERITVIPSAPATGYHRLPPGQVKEELRKRYRLKQSYILYVGGLNPRKNVTELIYAYSKINRDLSEGQLLIIPGPAGRHLDQLQSLVDSLNIQNYVVFPGFVTSEDLPLWYNGADLFVYPSLYEGFGLPPIEAMACGVPVITSNISSLPEVVGDAALLVNPHDTLELAETIRKVLNDAELAENLRIKGLEQCKKYTWEQNAARILELYHKVVEA